jgi:hypothetical protein
MDYGYLDCSFAMTDTDGECIHIYGCARNHTGCRPNCPDYDGDSVPNLGTGKEEEI